MSVIRRLTERRSLPTSIDPYQITARPFFPNYSGEIVTELTAFASTAVMSAVSLLADSVATMPLELTRQRAGRVEKLPTPSVLIKPNAHQTMFEFVHQTMLSLALHGCAYIYAPRRAGELPSEMRVLHPNLVKKAAMSDDGSSYVYSIDDQEYTGKDIRAIHWILLPNQVRAVSPLEAMRNTIGIGLAMDRFLSQFYGEGATPSSVLETEATITTEQAQVLRDTWSDAHTRRRRPAVLTGGLKWKPITTSAADSQMLEHREAIVRDIARAYRIPIHMINGSGGNSQTYQNIESAGTNFVRYTLLPFMRRIEDAISEMLPVTQHVRFNADEFMRADLITRVRAQQVQIMSGTLSPNEARQQENREPYEGGDQFIIGIAGSPLSGVEGDVDKPIIGVDADPPER
jgi:HK97 family phage portal protein